MQKFQTLDEFLNSLDDNKKQQVHTLREYILSADPTLSEHIKWNAPSYIHDGEDRITFNVMNKEGLVKLVFHMGALRKEDRTAEPILKDAPLIEWASDIRGYATFNDLSEITKNEESIRETVRRWLAIK